MPKRESAIARRLVNRTGLAQMKRCTQRIPRARLARIIHRGWAGLREAAHRSDLFGGVGDAADRGLRLRRGVCSGASGPVVYGGNFAIRPARLAKPA